MAVTQDIYDIVVHPMEGDEADVCSGKGSLGSNSTMYIRCASYAEAAVVDFDQNNIEITAEPGTTIDKGLTLSGDNILLKLLPGCDIQGDITVSGDNCSVDCFNGCDLDGISVTGENFHFNGGGKGTLLSGEISISSTASNAILHNFSSTTTGSDNNILVEATYVNIYNAKLNGAGARNIYIKGSTASKCKIIGCYLSGGDDGILVEAERAVIYNNVIYSSTTNGIQFDSSGDNGVAVSNIIEGASTVIDLTSSVSNCVVVMNRLDGTVSDSSTGSTVAANDTSTF